MDEFNVFSKFQKTTSTIKKFVYEVKYSTESTWGPRHIELFYADQSDADIEMAKRHPAAESITLVSVFDSGPVITDLNVGDSVLFHSYNDYAKQTVVKVTKYHIWVSSCDLKFRRSDGRPLNNYKTFWICRYDEEILQNHENGRKRKKVLSEVRSVNWHKLDEDVLEKIHTILNDAGCFKDAE